MFTIKLYSHGGARQRIIEGESFTILRESQTVKQQVNAVCSITAEITVHQKNSNDDRRYDVGSYLPGQLADPTWPELFDKAIIENAAGRTTEIIADTPK